MGRTHPVRGRRAARTGQVGARSQWAQRQAFHRRRPDTRVPVRPAREALGCVSPAAGVASSRQMQPNRAQSAPASRGKAYSRWSVSPMPAIARSSGVGAWSVAGYVIAQPGHGALATAESTGRRAGPIQGLASGGEGRPLPIQQAQWTRRERARRAAGHSRRTNQKSYFPGTVSPSTA